MSPISLANQGPIRDGHTSGLPHFSSRFRPSQALSAPHSEQPHQAIRGSCANTRKQGNKTESVFDGCGLQQSLDQHRNGRQYWVDSQHEDQPETPLYRHNGCVSRDLVRVPPVLDVEGSRSGGRCLGDVGQISRFHTLRTDCTSQENGSGQRGYSVDSGNILGRRVIGKWESTLNPGISAMFPYLCRLLSNNDRSTMSISSSSSSPSPTSPPSSGRLNLLLP